MILSRTALTAWWDIPWQDWLGVAGTVLGCIGLLYTYFQARDAKTAAENAETAAQAASKAVESTQSQLRANMQSMLLPGLQRVSQELDDAIGRGFHAEVRASLDRWRFQAGHVRGLLKLESPEPRTVIKALQDSVALASIATAELLENQKPVLDSCRQARKSIASACDEVTLLVGKNVTQVPVNETETTQ